MTAYTEKCLIDLKVKRHISIGWGMFTVTGSLGESSPNPEDVDFSQEPMCLLLPWVRKDYHNSGDLQKLLEPTPRFLKQDRPGTGVGGKYGELGTISTSEWPGNSLRLAQFFQKGKVKTLLY